MKSLLTNRKLRTAGLLLVLLTMGAGLAWARSATPPPAGQRIYDMQWLNINKWECPFYNDGRYGLDITIGTGQAGGAWPQPLHNCYIFGAGLWFGSIRVRTDDPGREDTLVTFGYNPNSGGTEMSPVTLENQAEGTGSPDDRIFVYPTDWPPLPRDRWETGDAQVDSMLIPYENFSLMDMWCAYSDVLPENHISPGKPQNIDVYETVYAWNYPSNQDIFFITYIVRNASTTDTLKECFMGAVCDADVGDATDDMVGTLLNTYVPGADTVKNVGYVGDNNNQENAGATWDGGTPGVYAYKFLESPRDENNNPLGMTAFKKFTIDIDPVTDAAQYLTMAGFDYRTGVYAPYDSAKDVAPADKRFVQCSGPFTLAPQQMVRLVIACMGAPYGGPGQDWQARPIDSLVHLAKLANQAQFIYDQGWLLPGPPLSPNITLVPGDNQVRIVWDNLPEVTPDPYWQKVASDTTKIGTGWDPVYRGYDFQGYIVYKSKNGSDWGILAQCDLDDSVTFNYPPGGDSVGTPDSLWIKATDAGLFYSAVDSNVTNGFTYYYCVAAYDWNFTTTEWDSTHRIPLDSAAIILRSGLVANFSTVPRWEAANYIMPTASVVTALGDTTDPGMRWKASVVVPAQVMADTYELRFLEPAYGGAASRSIYRYVVTDLRNDSVAIETTSFNYTVGNTMTRSMPVFNGLALSCTLKLTTPSSGFESTRVANGSFPAAKLTAGGTAQQGLWAFRGADYEVEFVTSPYLTAKVYDVTHGRAEVPYAAFNNLPATRAQANGWCFVSQGGRNPTDTLTASMGRICVCGAYAGDSIGVYASMIQDGDKWLLYGNKAGGTAPFLNVYQAVTTPGVAQVDSNVKLNVKVVPNPYIVFNAWERSSDQRYVRFTHLPNECTIRIYTVAGDLVKVINHVDTDRQPLDQGGTETWDFTNESPGSTGTAISGQLIASGVYVYHVQSPVGEAVGKFAVIY
jgi:hypothetical protein